MKKVIIILTILISMFSLTGCGENKQEKFVENKYGRKTVTSGIVKATLNEGGNIVINESDITRNATYIAYDFEGVTIGLLAVRDSSDNVKVVINTCQSCGGSPYAYFVQVGNDIECQNCGNHFAIDALDNLVPDGCNPIGIEERTDIDGQIIIGTEQLKNLKDKFENWEGPKA